MLTPESISSDSLTEEQWQIVHAVAQTLASEQLEIEKKINKKSDGIVTELKKTLTYLYQIKNERDGKQKYLHYLKTLVNHGEEVGHSGQTPHYYRTIERTCNKYLYHKINNSQTMLQILGWASRLVNYYKASPVEEITVTEIPEPLSQRQAEIAKVLESHKFEIDQILDAKVLGIKGNRVTYEILETVKLTEREPKKAGSLLEGQTTKVKIVAIKDDGSIKSVKCVD
ncbi:MAG: hypothetical protein VKN72_16900 [Nostocales cyanobacterium 94392]|nr:hypothetical protein [Nostocales cyanobacterium 94392]